MVCRKRSEAHVPTGTVCTSKTSRATSAGPQATRWSGPAKQGLTGVDLLLSTYGPALSALSAHWPVYSDRGRRRRPLTAAAPRRGIWPWLDYRGHPSPASQLVGSGTEFDPLTDFILMAWSMFAAREFPYDEARKLALATGGLEVAEVERAKLITAKSGSVTISQPHQRLRREGDSHCRE